MKKSCFLKLGGVFCFLVLFNSIVSGAYLTTERLEIEDPVGKRLVTEQLKLRQLEQDLRLKSFENNEGTRFNLGRANVIFSSISVLLEEGGVIDLANMPIMHQGIPIAFSSAYDREVAGPLTEKKPSAVLPHSEGVNSSVDSALDGSFEDGSTDYVPDDLTSSAPSRCSSSSSVLADVLTPRLVQVYVPTAEERPSLDGILGQIRQYGDTELQAEINDLEQKIRMAEEKVRAMQEQYDEQNAQLSHKLQDDLSALLADLPNQKEKKMPKRKIKDLFSICGDRLCGQAIEQNLNNLQKSKREYKDAMGPLIHKLYDSEGWLLTHLLDDAKMQDLIERIQSMAETHKVQGIILHVHSRYDACGYCDRWFDEMVGTFKRRLGGNLGFNVALNAIYSYSDPFQYSDNKYQCDKFPIPSTGPEKRPRCHRIELKDAEGVIQPISLAALTNPEAAPNVYFHLLSLEVGQAEQRAIEAAVEERRTVSDKDAHHQYMEAPAPRKPGMASFLDFLREGRQTAMSDVLIPLLPEGHFLPEVVSEAQV